MECVAGGGTSRTVCFSKSNFRGSHNGTNIDVCLTTGMVPNAREDMSWGMQEGGPLSRDLITVTTPWITN